MKRLVLGVVAAACLVAVSGCDMFGGYWRGGDRVCYLLRGNPTPYTADYSLCSMGNRNGPPSSGERQACYDIMAVSDTAAYASWCWWITGGSVYPI
jgi:hypothetical protein